MTARNLQRLEAQDRVRWRLGCKKLADPYVRGNICWAPGIKGSTFLKQNDDDEWQATINGRSYSDRSII